MLPEGFFYSLLCEKKNMIEGVVLKSLTAYPDERGSFRELIRNTDDFFEGFGQWSFSIMYQGVIKAWHLHKNQTDYFYVPVGTLKVVLCDMRVVANGQIEEYILDKDAGILKIPPRIAHGVKVLSGPANLMYITDKIYDPEDEMRISYDNTSIGYDWFKQEIK